MSHRIMVLSGGGTGHGAGGVGTMMLYLMAEWRRRGDGWDVRVVDTRGPRGLVVGGFWFGWAAVLLSSWRVSGRLALVHAQMTTRGSVVRKILLCGLARALGAAVVVQMHGADFFDFFEALSAPQQRAVRWLFTRVQHTVVLGECWRRFAIERLGVAPHRVSVVPNGVAAPPTHLRAALRRPVMSGGEAASRRVRILFLGRLGDRKGVPELLQALALPSLLRLDWTATIAGDGDVDRLGAMALGLDIADRVAFPGWVGRDHTGGLLREADILVLPSHHEAMPVAIVEALAHGIAVVATPVGVIPEFLTDGVNALLVPPGDVAQLASAIALLIEDEAARVRIAAAGHRVFSERLDVRATASRMAEIYRHVLRPSLAPPPGEAEASFDLP